MKNHEQTIRRALVSHYIGRLGFTFPRCNMTALANLEQGLLDASRTLAAPWKRAVAASLIPCVARQLASISGASPHDAVFEAPEIQALVAAADGNY